MILAPASRQAAPPECLRVARPVNQGSEFFCVEVTSSEAHELELDSCKPQLPQALTKYVRV